MAEMILAERPFMRPQGPSSAISCLKVRMMEFLPSTWKSNTVEGHGLQSKSLGAGSLCLGVQGLDCACEGQCGTGLHVGSGARLPGLNSAPQLTKSASSGNTVTSLHLSPFPCKQRWSVPTPADRHTRPVTASCYYRQQMGHSAAVLVLALLACLWPQGHRVLAALPVCHFHSNHLSPSVSTVGSPPLTPGPLLPATLEVWLRQESSLFLPPSPDPATKAHLAPLRPSASAGHLLSLPYFPRVDDVHKVISSSEHHPPPPHLP